MDAELWKNASLIFFFFMLGLVLDDFTWLYGIAKKDYFTYWVTA